ncbi:DEAD/DEAH box helicase [Paenibacillus sp. BAC0078]
MEYLFKLVEEINNYDGSIESSNNIRDLVCYISDIEEYKNDPIYQYAIFEAAQKMRTFGYIKGANKIELDDIPNRGISEVKHQSIQNYYTSKVYRNNLLDRRQKEIVDTFMSLNKKRLIISAPTSFGKTFLLKEILYLNKDRYNNIMLVFPTIALLNENTISINKFIKDKNLNYTLINNVYSNINYSERNIFILTPERTLKLLSDTEKLHFDFFFFDEVYKIDEDFSNDEESKSEKEESDNNSGQNRSKAFRIALYLLSKNVPEYYIAGPYLNLKDVKMGFKRYLDINGITIKQVDFEPTLRIEVDAWNKGVVERHPLLGEKKISFDYEKGINLNTKSKIHGIISYLNKNNLGQAIFYCSTPSNSMQYALDIIESLPENSTLLVKYGDFIEHLKNRYGIKYKLKEKAINTSDYWSLVKILSRGYGVHHGKFPKYIQREILHMFNEGDIQYLFCTSTIIEGVNTNAKNVIVINNSVGNKIMTSFALKNIKGRAGRYYHHFIGRVFYTDKKQRDIEKQDVIRLNFPTYDSKEIQNVDIDNSYLEDLEGLNLIKKTEREKKYNKEKLPDDVFVKNRLYDREIQERYLNYLLENRNFNKYIGLVENTSVHYFLNSRMMNKILDSVTEVGIISEGTKKYYHAVVSRYSIERFRGLMEYQLQNNDGDNESKIDKIYLTVFDQIKTIIEFELPKLLSFFEAIFQQAGKLNGVSMDEFNLTPIIRFFELGVKSVLGIFLVEYGYPIEAIRIIEDNFQVLSNLDKSESIAFVIKNFKAISKLLDTYETSLLRLALEV